jgi:hypothetical protein
MSSFDDCVDAGTSIACVETIAHWWIVGCFTQRWLGRRSGFLEHSGERHDKANTLSGFDCVSCDGSGLCAERSGKFCRDL